MSKRRYAELEKRLAEGLPHDHVEFALRAVRDALRFDPAASQYTPEFGKRRADKRRLLLAAKHAGVN
jgi:hypothetical protein